MLVVDRRLEDLAVPLTSSSYPAVPLLTPILPLLTSRNNSCVSEEVFLNVRLIPLRSRFAVNNGPEILPTCDMPYSY